MLSILIPTYNYNITVLVNSLLLQLERESLNFEILFCEDGSTIHLEENLKLTSRKNTKRLTNLSNLGRTSTRSILANAALFDWLLFLDADIEIIKEDFINQYIKSISKEKDIISGGTSYDTTSPENKSLRWKFGVKRESRTATERQKSPEYIISQNLLVRKSIFNRLNSIKTRHYGLDNIFSYQILKHQIKVLHIDNPILHKGLENNNEFLSKSKEAISTLIYFENNKMLSNDFTRLQKAFQKLKGIGLLKIATYFIKINLGRIKNNLLSHNPSLFLFDLYRLYHYSILKKNE